jgi:hypothetical protein
MEGMDLVTVDLRRSGKASMSQDDIPLATERILLSYNDITLIPTPFFFGHNHAIEFDLSHNRLRSITFLRCFGALRFLDVSGNNLSVEDLMDLHPTIIMRIDVRDNTFTDIFYEHPLFIPTLLRHCWIINDVFQTDFDRSQHEAHENGLEFGEILVASQRHPGSTIKHHSTGQSGRLVLEDRAFELDTKIVFTPARVEILKKLDPLPQIDRLQYLATQFAFELPDGDFADYFGLAVAVLAHIWINEPLPTVPHLLCRTYWFAIGEDVLRMRHFELTLLLYRLCLKPRPFSTIENELWNSLNPDRFVRTGKAPLLGSTSRLLIAAFLARAIALVSSEASTAAADDLRCYFKFRKSCGFTSLDSTIESVYQEIVAPLWQPARSVPRSGDPIEVVHPLTGEITTAHVIITRNGRVYARHDDIIAQVFACQIFWDGRGIWREATRKEAKFLMKQKEREQIRTFVTAADLTEAENEPDLSIATPAITVKVTPPDRSMFLQIGRASLKVSPFVNEAEPPDESRLMPGWKTFRGIVEPPFPKPERGNRRSRRNPQRADLINGVVNVVRGTDFGDGMSPRRFNVRTTNMLTGRSRYAWVTEDEITPEDSERLMEIYRAHVASKMHSLNVSPSRGRLSQSRV